MHDAIDLGVAGVRPLDFLSREPETWRRVHERLHATAFLRSEGTVVTVGPPQRASRPLVETCREVVRRFDRFFAGAAQTYFEREALRTDYLVNTLIEPLLAIDRAAPVHLPLARLDCVLAPDGSLRVIEINPVGVTLIHLRSLLYLVRGLWRAGLHDAAIELDSLAGAAIESFDRTYRLCHQQPRPRPTLGALTPAGWLRATNFLLRDAFRRRGWDYVWGGPSALEVTDRGIQLAGRAVDVLWPDFLFYWAYQQSRYSQTRFPSAIADYSRTPEQAAAILADGRFLGHLRERRVVHLSPATSYLCLSKSLLSWIHDQERPVPDGDREWLERHVARTFSARDRSRGALSREQARADRPRLLVKPCQYGGSHGVRLGCETSDAEWAAALDALWNDDAWVVQEYWPPAQARDGSFVSLGLASHGGELGGITLRAGPARVVSARDSAFVPVAIDQADSKRG
jgi:glutathionylspermidine synthase